MEILVHIKKVLKLSGFIAIDDYCGIKIYIIIRYICILALLSNSIASIWYFTYKAINFLDYAMSFTVIISLGIRRLHLFRFIGFYYVPIRDAYCRLFQYFV